MMATLTGTRTDTITSRRRLARMITRTSTVRRAERCGRCSGTTNDYYKHLLQPFPFSNTLNCRAYRARALKQRQP